MENEEINECLGCDCYDLDVGCTMPIIDRLYVCDIYRELNFKRLKRDDDDET